MTSGIFHKEKSLLSELCVPENFRIAEENSQRFQIGMRRSQSNSNLLQVLQKNRRELRTKIATF